MDTALESQIEAAVGALLRAMGFFPAASGETELAVTLRSGGWYVPFTDEDNTHNQASLLGRRFGR